MAHFPAITGWLKIKSAQRNHFLVDEHRMLPEAPPANMPAKSLELKHNLRLIGELDSEISEIESEIKQIMGRFSSPILTIPGIGYRMGAMILAEIGDFFRFDSQDKILAYAVASPSAYQSGQLDSSYSHMVKRGLRYLRFVLITATKYVCHWNEIFGAYLQKKISEGKNYNFAITHAIKTCTVDLCNGKIRQALHKNGLALSVL